MKKFFTGLSGLIILVQVGTTSLSAQNPATTFKTYARELQEPAPDNIQPRAAAGWRPDSAVIFTAAGEKSSKQVYTYDAAGERTTKAFNWENNRWVSTDSYTEILLPSSYSAVSYSTYSVSWPHPVRGKGEQGFGLTSGSVGLGLKAVPTHDAKGNLTQVEYYIYEIANPDNSYLSSRYTFSYNGNNQPVLIEDLYLKVTYQWDSNGNITFYERSESLDGQWIITDRYTLNNGGSIWETDNPWTKEREKTVMKNDGRGNPAIYQYYTWTAGKWYMTHYAVFYPNDLTSGEGLANEVVDVSPSSSAWSQNGIIHIRSARPQQVSVYSLSGAKLYEGRVQAGTTALDGVRFPKGIYIIVLSGGESLKAPVY